jgi:hypothetical protein
MRLLYVTVVASLVSMILIGSYLYAPAGLKAAVIPPVTENISEINGVVKRGDALFDIFRKYKIDMEKFLQVKKASANSEGLRNLRADNLYILRIDDKNNHLSGAITIFFS